MRRDPKQVWGGRVRLVLACLLISVITLVGACCIWWSPASIAMAQSPSPTPVATFAPPSEAPVTAIPPAMPPVNPAGGEDVVNILLLGSDTTNPINAGRTDAIMVASINLARGTVSLLSIPRDLFVYIPGWTMQRINTAFGYGEQIAPGYGYTLLKDTLRYNLGLEIDHYARVDFNDFQAIIDALGGVEITVDCALQDWILKAPDLDPQNEENWELLTLPVGVHVLDGRTALWYARSRRTSSDFDRGRRQQDLIRAIWLRLRRLGLLEQVSALWGQVTDIVETDLQVQDVLELIPVALTLDSDHIAQYMFVPHVHVESWLTPSGAAVQLPIREAVEALMQRFLQPPTANRLVRNGPRVEIVNATGYAGMDRVAADLLAWEGFHAVAAGAETRYAAQTTIYDFTGRTKGGILDDLLVALHLPSAPVLVSPDPGRTTDYRVILGGDYRACHHNVMPPVPTPTPPPDGESTP